MLRHGFLQNLAFPLNIFAMAEVAMAVPNKPVLYRKTSSINVKNRVYIQMLQTHTSKI